MKTHHLSFGEITILKVNLAEVIINEGVVMDLKMVNEYHNCLLKNLETPFSLLINKKHSYTYTFDAQTEIANLEAIKAMAVVTHSYVTKMATDFLINMNSGNNWNIKLFKLKEDAITWLENEA